MCRPPVRYGAVNYDFVQYDKAIAGLIAVNQQAFDRAVGDGKSELRGWTVGVEVGAAICLILLFVAIRLRFLEFR